MNERGSKDGIMPAQNMLLARMIKQRVDQNMTIKTRNVSDF